MEVTQCLQEVPKWGFDIEKHEVKILGLYIDHVIGLHGIPAEDRECLDMICSRIPIAASSKDKDNKNNMDNMDDKGKQNKKKSNKNTKRTTKKRKAKKGVANASDHHHNNDPSLGVMDGSNNNNNNNNNSSSSSSSSRTDTFLLALATYIATNKTPPTAVQKFCARLDNYGINYRNPSLVDRHRYPIHPMMSSRIKTLRSGIQAHFHKLTKNIHDEVRYNMTWTLFVNVNTIEIKHILILLIFQ